MGKAVLLVEIDLIHKGIKTPASVSFMTLKEFVEIDLIHKGIKTMVFRISLYISSPRVEIDLIHKGIKTQRRSAGRRRKNLCRNRPDS